MNPIPKSGICWPISGRRARRRAGWTSSVIGSWGCSPSRRGRSSSTSRRGVKFPAMTRGLIDDPLEQPELFPIRLDSYGWELWDIFCAFADQYASIYEQPQRYGVRGHDYSNLWIELLYYYP